LREKEEIVVKQHYKIKTPQSLKERGAVILEEVIQKKLTAS